MGMARSHLVGEGRGERGIRTPVNEICSLAHSRFGISPALRPCEGAALVPPGPKAPRRSRSSFATGGGFLTGSPAGLPDVAGPCRTPSGAGLEDVVRGEVLGGLA